MTQIRNKVLVSAFVLLGTSQAFAMGAKRPANTTASRISTIVSSLGQTQSNQQTSSNYLGQILGSVMPLITASSSLSSSLGVFTNVVIPLVNSIRQSSAAVPNGQSSAYLDQIESLAQESVCFQGQVPADFLAKISLNYARGICQLKAKSKTVLFISASGLDKILQKALSNYQPKLMGFTPLESKALTSVPVCNQLLNNVQELISNDPYSCQDI